MALPDGGYAVAWGWNDYPAVPNNNIFIRIFNSNGDGGPVLLAAPSSTSPFDRQLPSLAALTDGGLALIWADSDYSLRGQYLGPDGVIRGAMFKVNSTFDKRDPIGITRRPHDPIWGSAPLPWRLTFH